MSNHEMQLHESWHVMCFCMMWSVLWTGGHCSNGADIIDAEELGSDEEETE